MSKPTRIESIHMQIQSKQKTRGENIVYIIPSHLVTFFFFFFAPLVCYSIWQIKLTESGEWLGSAFKKNTLIVPRMQRKSHHMNKSPSENKCQQHHTVIKLSFCINNTKKEFTKSNILVSNQGLHYYHFIFVPEDLKTRSGKFIFRLNIASFVQ